LHRQDGLGCRRELRNGGWVMESHPKWPSNKLPRYIMWYHLEILWYIIPPSRCMYDTCIKETLRQHDIFEEFSGNKKHLDQISKVSQSFRQHSSHVGLCALEAGECEFLHVFFDKWGEAEFYSRKDPQFKKDSYPNPCIQVLLRGTCTNEARMKSWMCTTLTYFTWWFNDEIKCDLLHVSSCIITMMVQWCAIRYGHAHAASSNWHGWWICKVTRLSCSTRILLTQYGTFDSWMEICFGRVFVKFVSIPKNTRHGTDLNKFLES